MWLKIEKFGRSFIGGAITIVDVVAMGAAVGYMINVRS